MSLEQLIRESVFKVVLEKGYWARDAKQCAEEAVKYFKKHSGKGKIYDKCLKVAIDYSKNYKKPLSNYVPEFKKTKIPKQSKLI